MAGNESVNENPLPNQQPEPGRPETTRSKPEPAGERDRMPTHLVGNRDSARAKMVDVGGKQPTARRAVAEALVWFPPGLLAEVLAGKGPKGAIEEVSRIAGVLAAKRTSELVPLCHGLALEVVDITFNQRDPSRLEIRCIAQTFGATGVEMEAMVGASHAALCVYDMVKGLDKGVRIEGIALLEKSGGKSGEWKAG